MAKSGWEREDSQTDREVRKREREEDLARRKGSRARPQASRAHVRTVRSPSGGGVRIPTLWRGVLKGRRHFSAAPKEYRRRSIARVKFVANKQPGQWGAHGRYLAREGAQEEGKKGKGFGLSLSGQNVSSPQTEDIDIEKTLHSWQMSGDPRIWKIILSPEDGARLDLRSHTQSVMSEFSAAISEELGQPFTFEWVAVDHYNTENPHVHIAIRGVDTNGEEIVLSPPQIQKIREISAEMATRELGYRSEHEIQVARDRDVNRNRFTRLDSEIAKNVVQLTDGRLAVTVPEDPEDRNGPSMGIREKIFGSLRPATPAQQHIARLQHLETLGLAEKIGARTWSLDPSWRSALKEMETIRTRTQMLQEHRALLSDPRAIPVVTRLEAGQRLTGRVLGTSLDEDRDRLLLMLEGTDGRVHLLYENSALQSAREMGDLKPETLVSIQAEKTEGRDGRSFTRTRVIDHGITIPLRGSKLESVQIAESVLRQELEQEEKSRTVELSAAPITDTQEPGLAGFAALFHRQLQEYRAKAERKRRERAKQEKEKSI